MACLRPNHILIHACVGCWLCHVVISTRFDTSGFSYLQAPSDADTAFALKVRVHVYPEDATACWVMMAVCQPVVDVEPAVSGLSIR